jgi:hypothetical protein
MAHAVGMGMSQTQRRLADTGTGKRWRERPPVSDQRAKVWAEEILHHHEWAGAGSAAVENSSDVRVGQAGGSPCGAAEATPGLAHLDRHDPIKRDLPGPVDRAMAAPAEQAKELIARQTRHALAAGLG